jgi:hypothetical protein
MAARAPLNGRIGWNFMKKFAALVSAVAVGALLTTVAVVAPASAATNLGGRSCEFGQRAFTSGRATDYVTHKQTQSGVTGQADVSVDNYGNTLWSYGWRSFGSSSINGMLIQYTGGGTFCGA